MIDKEKRKKVRALQSLFTRNGYKPDGTDGDVATATSYEYYKKNEVRIVLVRRFYKLIVVVIIGENEISFERTYELDDRKSDSNLIYHELKSFIEFHYEKRR